MDTIEQVVAAIEAIKGNQFVGITYKSKSSGKVARYVFLVGLNYTNLIRKSLLELTTLIPTLETDLEKNAAAALQESFKKTLAAQAIGKVNSDYTKIGIYETLCNGIKRHRKDGSMEISGIIISENVIEPGEYKPVKSKPETIAKNKLKKRLSISAYRTLAIDPGFFDSIRVSGNEIEVK